MDFAPILFDLVHVEKGAGYNAAVWNLPNRNISFDGGRWRCNGEILHFFHFSGFDVAKGEFRAERRSRVGGLLRKWTSEALR